VSDLGSHFHLIHAPLEFLVREAPNIERVPYRAEWIELTRHGPHQAFRRAMARCLSRTVDCCLWRTGPADRHVDLDRPTQSPDLKLSHGLASLTSAFGRQVRARQNRRQAFGLPTRAISCSS